MCVITVRILAAVLIMLLVFGQSAPAFGQSCETEEDSAIYSKECTDAEEAPGNGQPQAEELEYDNREASSDEGTITADEGTPVPEKERDEIRSVLQNTDADQDKKSIALNTDESDPEEEMITVRVSVVNETFPKSEGAPWEGTLLDTEVTIPANYTMMQALHKACRDNNIESAGTDGSYVVMIGGISEFQGGGGAGWMGTLNDWFTNEGFDSVSIKDGDHIAIEYTCDLGEDIGSSFTNRDKRVKALTTSTGELSPEFDKDYYSYNLMVPEGTQELSIYTTAVNRNYLVRSMVNEKEYERGAKIPVHDGTKIKVVCGDPSWPTMNSYEQQDTTPAKTYTITVFEGAYDFLVDTTGTRCSIELERDTCMYYAGEKVKVALNYDKERYQIVEDSVKVYIGGSRKYITPDKEREDVYTFTMPCNDVEFRAECEMRYDYPLELRGSLTGCSMSSDHSDGIYHRGERVTFALTAPEGKRINDLTVKACEKESGEEIELEHVSQDTYSFEMPGDHVVIYAESEKIEKNGLKNYTITTDYGEVKGEMKETSRTSICMLPERATKYDLSLDIDESEELVAVRAKDIYGNIAAYTETEIKGIDIGTRNTALLGKELAVTVLTKDEDGKTHTYTIRVRTQTSSFDQENPDALIIPESVDHNNMVLPFTKTLMTSGVVLYEVDYPTTVYKNKAETANVLLSFLPSYEEEQGSLEIRCKYATFRSGDVKDGYVSTVIKIEPGKTQEIPIEADFTLPSGEVVTRKYLYRITNGRYAEQRFRVLSSKGRPMTPTSLLLDGEQIDIKSLQFEEGVFTFDMLPGSHTVYSMKKTVDFTIEDNLLRPIETEIIDIQTDVPEYDVTITCRDKAAKYTIKETNTGVKYYVKSSESVFSLPPGIYELKTINEDRHLYSRDSFTVSTRDTKVTASIPGLLDPEFVVTELNMLEEIQTFDLGDGRMKIYVPEYQEDGIIVYPVAVTNPDNIKIITESKSQSFIGGYYWYYVQRDKSPHSLYVKYRVYNEKEGKEIYNPEVLETEEMELFMPQYDEYSVEELIMPPDVRTLSIGFGIEDGSIVGGTWGGFNEYYELRKFGSSIPVLEKNVGITDEQMKAAAYKVKYTMRYRKTEDEEFKNVWIYYSGLYAAFFRASNDHECDVFEPSTSNNGSLLVIDPDMSDYGYPDKTVNGWYEVTAWFENSMGAKSKPATITVYKEGRPPEDVVVSTDKQECVYDSKQNDPVYSNKPVTITVSATDQGIGLHEQAYSYDGGKSWTSDDTVTLTEPAVIDLQNIWVRDKCGYTSTVKRVIIDGSVYGEGGQYMGVDWFDSSNGPHWWDNTQGTKYFYVDTGKPTVGVISSYDEQSKILGLTVRASDSVSGLAEEAYSFDGGSTWQKENTCKVTLGEYPADQIVVRDKAGNRTVYNQDFIWTAETAGKAAPKITDVRIEYGEGGKGKDGRNWYKSAKLTIEAEEGVYDIYGYSFDGTVFTESDSRTYDSQIMIKAGAITVTDMAGNMAVYDKDIDLTNLDSEPPKIDSYSFQGQAGHQPVREIYTRISASDALSGNLKYAVTVIPLSEFIRGYPEVDLELEWSDSIDDDQFKVSNIGKKYDKVDLADAGDYIQHGSLWHGERNAAVAWGVRLWVKDAAGNITYKDAWVLGGYIDQEGPAISEVTTEYKYFDSTSGIVKVYVAATEPMFAVGLAAKAYSFDGGKTWQASNMTSIPIGASIPAGQIMVRDKFGNTSVYNKVVKTTLQDVIKRINDLDPRTAKNRDYKEIIDLYNQLSDREKSKVYNWQDFLDMLGNRKDQDWDDDFGDIGEPDDGEQGEDPQDPDDPGDDEEGEGDDDGSDGGGAGDDDGKPTDGSGSGKGGGTPEARDADGGNDTDTVSVALSNTSTSNTPDVKAKAGQSYREAEIDRKGAGGMLSQGMVKLWELILLIFIIGGAYTYGAQKRYRRYRNDAA